MVLLHFAHKSFNGCLRKPRLIRGKKYKRVCVTCSLQPVFDRPGRTVPALGRIYGSMCQLLSLFEKFFILADQHDLPIPVPLTYRRQSFKHMPIHRFSIDRIKKFITAKSAAVSSRHINHSNSHFSRSPIAIFSLVIGSSRNHRPVAL